MDLTIRKMSENDLCPLYELLSCGQVMQYLEPPYTRDKAAQFLENAGLSDPLLIYAAELKGIFTAKTNRRGHKAAPVLYAFDFFLLLVSVVIHLHGHYNGSFPVGITVITLTFFKADIYPYCIPVPCELGMPQE